MTEFPDLGGTLIASEPEGELSPEFVETMEALGERTPGEEQGLALIKQGNELNAADPGSGDALIEEGQSLIEASLEAEAPTLYD